MQITETKVNVFTVLYEKKVLVSEVLSVRKQVSNEKGDSLCTLPNYAG